jgi:hypothetical protein
MTVRFTLKPLIEAQARVEAYIADYLKAEGQLNKKSAISKFTHDVDLVIATEEHWVMMNFNLVMYLTLGSTGEGELTTTITWREL